MKTTILIFATLFVSVLNSCNNGSSSSERPKTAEELKMELKLQEEQNPLSYLDDNNVTLQQQNKKIKNGGLFRDPEYAPDGAIIEGDFINSATLAKFKDIIVKVSFFSQTKTLIEEKQYVLYEYYNPHSTKHFTMKIDVLPQAYHSFSFEVTGATVVN